jgi:hypothetical protein
MVAMRQRGDDPSYDRLPHRPGHKPPNRKQAEIEEQKWDQSDKSPQAINPVLGRWCAIFGRYPRAILSAQMSWVVNVLLTIPGSGCVGGWRRRNSSLSAVHTNPSEIASIRPSVWRHLAGCPQTSSIRLSPTKGIPSVRAGRCARQRFEP